MTRQRQQIAGDEEMEDIIRHPTAARVVRGRGNMKAMTVNSDGENVVEEREDDIRSEAGERGEGKAGEAINQRRSGRRSSTWDGI
jgi:hypothetical protein